MTQTEPSLPSTEPISADPHVTALLSHDIRSALSRVVSASQMLEASDLEGENAEHVARIKAAALYINDLLSEAGGETDLVPVTELGPALDQLREIWGAEAAQKGLGFSIESKGLMPEILRLPQLDFMRVFNNIIGNALKFSRSGALHVRLARFGSGALRIDVEDEGPGFEDEALAKLFMLEQQPAGSGESGSGFGLFIARSLLEKAGAEIKAETRPTGGARVTALFPEDLLVVAAKPKSEVPVKAGLPDLSHLKILLAEDNPTNQLVATQMLKKMNATVETASDGVEAMARFESGDFNLGLIDIEMPRKSGLEVMREIREREDERAGTTLLALTAYVLPEHRERIMAAGADGIIAKPLTDIAAFGNAILVITGEGEPAPAEMGTSGPDGDIQMDIYSGLKEIIGHESMLELLAKVKSDLTDVQEGVLAGVAQKDVAPIRANTHILISVAGAIGAVNLQHIAEQLNATAKTGDWARIVPETTRCAQGIGQVIDFVTGELER